MATNFLVDNSHSKEDKMFKLVSKYTPSGDQPKAIDNLVKGIREGKKHQVLLGATGTGKTFTIANVSIPSSLAFLSAASESAVSPD